MEYEGLSEDDLGNVRSLNRAWLRLQHSDDGGLERISGSRLERLSGVPFLLFSYREQDDKWWSSLLEEGKQADMLDARPRPTGELRALQVAGLAFLRELARLNPYVARVVSGASLHWCEQIASAPLLRVLECAGTSAMILPRFDDTSSQHRRLLRRGGSNLRDTRVFAQIGALQALLTGMEMVSYPHLAAAACRMPRTAQQVADEV